MSFLATFSLLSISALSLISADNNNVTTDFTQPPGWPSTCQTFVTYRVRSPRSSLGAVSDLFGISRMSIAAVNNLTSEDARLAPDRVLLIPITCTSNGTRYFSNATYPIERGDTFYSVSTREFQNLTEYHLVLDANPALKPNNLTIGAAAVFPLLCKCPGEIGKGSDQYLVTYVWQPGDDVFLVGNMFEVSPSDIVRANNNRNFTSALCLPVLIPTKSLPILRQRFPSEKTKSRTVRTAISTSLTAFLIILLALMAFFYKKRKSSTRSGFDPSEKAFNSEDIESKAINSSKILPGLSGYLGKPIVYDPNVIVKATMNFNERCKIGRSVYKAVIDNCAFAVKKTGDATEEVGILQRLNHANLVNLSGISSDNDGNFYLVHEFAENGSLESWLHPKIPASLRTLTWKQRLLIALDVANGLQYLHEHTEPSIVHKDITTGNILLDGRFKAKIGNFGSARRATCPVMLNIDVFSFGVVLLELLSGRKVMETKEGISAWKEVKVVLDVEGRRKEALAEWMDPSLKDSCPIDDALSLAVLARACTAEKSLDRPTIGEIVFGLSVVAQASPTWNSRFESIEMFNVANSIIAR
ncbi:serine/threonine receptor-like kinase NFP [Andrographis paniculata]|uniref:serine/threonine receptor-like kinase NFP n=1 Tax=Andrographis paniculata TaxID=175694 RepID=UPI0021E94269|nr:serine/threonine receptor-like kinase NFP [Andrographis paniculata]